MNKLHRVLIVDDEPLILTMLQETLSRHPLEVRSAATGNDALHSLQKEQFDLVITDVRLPDASGLEVLEQAKGMEIPPGVIIMTAFGTISDAVEAMKSGAYDYITKPFDLDKLESLLKRYFRRFQFERRVAGEDGKASQKEVVDIIGRSVAMQKIFRLIERIAPTNSTVLIHGESGTGKELVAAAIHGLSRRSNEPFIKVNCAALPSSLIESELFGHVRGAFTGATQNKDGKFVAAHKGTILLDEITEMELPLQSKLLRVLQEREVVPLGTNESRRVDVRVLATTNRNLPVRIKNGQFRDDLYFRLNVVPIELPPLRERREDIASLVEYFVEKKSKINYRVVSEVRQAVYELLEKYDWPGNVRQLENFVERAIVTSVDDFLDAKHFDFLGEGSKSASFDPSSLIGMTRNEVERLHILEVLHFTDGQRKKAADLLGINVRTLRNKITHFRKDVNLSEKYRRALGDAADD